VLVLGPHGRVHERNNPFLSAAPVTPVPATAAEHPAIARAQAAVAGHHDATPTRTPKKPAVTVKSVLSALQRRGAITAAV
jgi:hypothetical protein